MAGRSTKLTPERQEKIVQAILQGNYFVTACAYAGVSITTGYEWLARGEGKHRSRPRNRACAEFAEAVRLAEAQAEVEAVGVIKGGFGTNPRLALEFLSRRHPERWGQRDTLTILRKLADEVEGMSDAELDAVLGRRAGEPGAEETGGAEAPSSGEGDAAPGPGSPEG